MDTFAEIRSLLAQAPSERIWQRLCAFAVSSESARFVDELLPYTLHHLDRAWPDSLRVADRAWLRAVHEGAPAPWLSMARVIEAGVKHDERTWQWTFDEDRQLDAFVEPLGESDFIALIESGVLHNASHVFFKEQEIGMDGAAALASAPFVAKLESLIVHDDEETVERLLMLLSKRDDLRLRELGANGGAFGDVCNDYICDIAATCGLESLELRGAVTGLTAGKRPLSTLARSLVSLELYESLLDETLGALIQIPFEKLRHIGLGDSSIEPDGVDLLLATEWLAGITSMDLSWANGLDSVSIGRLVRDPKLAGLERLDMMSSAIGNDEVVRILSGELLPALEWFELGIADHVTSSTLEDVEGGYSPNLKYLGLGTCSMFPDALDFVERGDWRHLHAVDLPNNDPVTESIVEMVAMADELPQLRRLGLGENEMPDQLIVEMVRAMRLPSMVHLDLRNNQLTDDGAKELARCEEVSSLEVLDVRYNRLSEEGVEALFASENLARCAIRV